MGEIALAAKISHVPSMWMSEKFEKYRGIRQNAVDGHREIGRRARERGVETFVVLDCHWITNQGFHVNGLAHFEGEFTSPEMPHFLNDMSYRFDGDPDLAMALANAVAPCGTRAIAHDDPNLPVEYGTLMPMHLMNEDGWARVVPVAANQFASIDEGRQWGAAMAKAVRDSGRKVALLASGSLSHQFWPNALSEAGIFTVNTEFNRQVDFHVLHLWREGRWAEFLAMLPDYAERCHGECRMIDTAMLFGALGWDGYAGRGEVIGDYFGSSGTGQVNVDFSLPEAA